MTYLGTGAFSALIITPEMLTPDPFGIDEEAAAHRATAARLSAWADTRANANLEREGAIQSPGSEAMHAVNRQVVVDIRSLADAYTATAKMYEQEAQIVRDVDRDQGNIDREAHEKLSAAKNPAEIEEIVDEHRTSAEAMSVRAADVIYGQHARWDKTHGAQLLDLTTRLSKPLTPISLGPPPLAPPPSGGGQTKPLSKEWDPKGDTEAPTPGANTPVDQGGSPGSEKPGNGPGKRVPERGGDGGQDGAGNGQGPGQGVGGSGGLPFSPLSGGGLPGSGGGGLGSGGPLSSLMSGVGSNPAASGLGSGVPAANPVSNAAGSSALGNPAGMFAQGLSSGASSVSPVSSASPAATPGPASVGGGSAGGLAAPAAGGGSPAAPAAAGASGLHATPAAAGAGQSATSSAMPTMLPSTGMGAAPSGAGAAGGAGPAVSSAGASTNATTAAAGAAASGAAGGGQGIAGGTLVPGAVVSPLEAGPGRRPLSRAAQEAAQLARLLQYQCRSVSAPIHWAVGVFESRADAGSETVIMSGEGSGYVPAGVFVPRTVRLLVADGLVDRAFRNTWFGCVDPARVLVEYARMRAATGWELVAAATSDQSSSLRQCGVEHVESYAFPMSVAEIPLPVLDGMHVHRLQLEFPDLFERLTNLSAADDASARRMMMVLARDLIDEVNGFQHLIDLPRTWSALVAGNEPSADEWDKFQKLTELEFLVTTTKRPPACPVEVYRQAWMVGRAMEVVSGFGDRPLPLPDMVYALSAAWPGVDVRRQVEPLLRAAELDLGWY